MAFDKRAIAAVTAARQRVSRFKRQVCTYGPNSAAWRAPRHGS